MSSYPETSTTNSSDQLLAIIRYQSNNAVIAVLSEKATWMSQAGKISQVTVTFKLKVPCRIRHCRIFVICFLFSFFQYHSDNAGHDSSLLLYVVSINIYVIINSVACSRRLSHSNTSTAKPWQTKMDQRKYSEKMNQYF